MRSCWVVVFVLVLADPASATGNGLADLRRLMTERLAVMEYVAAYKWNEGLPVSDEAREARVLGETLERSGVDGTATEDVARAIKAQMEAAKTVQAALIQKWSATNKARGGAVPDLQVSLRPKISRVSNDLIATYLAVQDDLDDCRAQELLEPVPSELADFPEAWGLAVAGVLAAPDLCDGPQN